MGDDELVYGGVCPVCGDEFFDGFDDLDEDESYDARVCIVEKYDEDGEGSCLIHLEGDDLRTDGGRVDRCRGCGAELGAGYLCDGCDTVEGWE